MIPRSNRRWQESYQVQAAGRVVTLLLMRDASGHVDVAGAAKKLKTSARTVYRYMSAIRKAGMEIQPAPLRSTAAKDDELRREKRVEKAGRAILGDAVHTPKREMPDDCVCGAARGHHGIRKGVFGAGRCEATGCPEYMAKGE